MDMLHVMYSSYCCVPTPNLCIVSWQRIGSVLVAIDSLSLHGRLAVRSRLYTQRLSIPLFTVMFSNLLVPLLGGLCSSTTMKYFGFLLVPFFLPPVLAINTYTHGPSFAPDYVLRITLQ